jgi:DNA ligase-1
MLAGGVTSDLKASEFPVWVERKYDGIRLLLHKSTDQRGSVLCGAYTRNRGDWLEQISGLDASIRHIPAHNCIVDGELFGTILDIEHGVRPATVYEVYASLQGQAAQPVTLRFAAFDLLYFNNADITVQPLQQRRQTLIQLLSPLSLSHLPVPLSVAEGQLAANSEDVNRLFHHFRSQGYEGIICKQLQAPYHLASRDPGWKKRKPEITLDLAILGATQAVTTKDTAGMFGSYVIGGKNSQGGFDIVGDVAGIDRLREQEIIREIMNNGLMTGQRMERPSASGARPGFVLRPHIVVTVRFEGIARDQATGALSLRDPKLVVIRSDKPVMESDSTADIQELYLRQRVG